MRLSREKLREMTSLFLERARSTGSEGDRRAAFVFSAAALRAATRRSGTFSQDALHECIQHANILGDLRDTEGAAYLLGASAATVVREPFADQEQNLALLDYLANEAAGIDDKRTAVAIRQAHHARLAKVRGTTALETAEAGMALAQVRGCLARACLAAARAPPPFLGYTRSCKHLLVIFRGPWIRGGLLRRLSLLRWTPG